MTFKLRENRTKMITAQTCHHWENRDFLSFTNSLIGRELGIRLVITKRHGRDKTKTVYGLIDELEPLNIREIQTLPKGQCLLDGGTNHPLEETFSSSKMDEPHTQFRLVVKQRIKHKE